MTRLSSFAGTTMMAALAALAAACGGGGGGTPNPDAGGDAGADAGACSTDGGNGTLSIHFTGVPSGGGSAAIADLQSPSTPAVQVTSDMDFPEAAGRYSVTAFRVAPAAAAGALTRTAYEPSVSMATSCVQGGQTTTVTVTYTAIDSSNKLWVGNSGAGKAMLGFGPDAIAATGAPTASVIADTTGSDGFTFDPAGNLWVLGATTTDKPLARFPANSLGASGAPAPDVTLDSPSIGGGIPGAKVVAFDSSGNLWVSVVAADKVIRFTPEQLAAGGTQTAAVEIAGLDAPSGIAFDASKNMWVASSNPVGAVRRIDASRLAASGTGADATITAQTAGAVTVPLASAHGIAFDGTGNLWVAFDTIIARLTPADLAGTGAKNVTPAVQVDVGVSSITEGIAFDEQGGLWVALGMGQFGRLAPAQLTASGTNVVPSTVISSPDVAYAGWFAIYPAPANTPLAHRLP